MPKIKTIFKRPVAKWGLLFCFAFATAIIIHSCKKDNNPSENITDPEVLQAKSWYEGSFTTPGNNNGSKLNMQGSKLVNTTPSTDLSQYISPYWSKGTTYSRLNANVVELPAYAASKNVALSLNTALTAAQAKNTINSFIILKDIAGYHAYVMTLIADSTYTKNNPNILTQNKYNKRDTNFSGRVIYSTPNGKLVSSWRYVKGQLVSGSPYIGNNAKSNSLVANNNNTAHNYVTEECYTVYFYTVDPDGGEVAGSQQDLYTVCDVIINGSTSIPTAGSGAGNSSSPSKPSPCVPGGSSSSAALYTGKGNYASSYVLQQNVGFPSPTTPALANPCPTGTTTDPVTAQGDPCAGKAAVNKRAADAALAAKNKTIQEKTSSTGKEYGTNQNLTSLSGSTYVDSPVTEGGEDSWTPTVTWDSTNGYTVGFSHGHPDDNGPSPLDVSTLVTPIGSRTLLNASPVGGQSAVQFYESNAQVTTTTSTGNYVVTVNNWTDVSNTITNNYSTAQDRTNFNETFKNKANDYLTDYPKASKAEASVFALMSMFGNSINVYYAPNGSTTFAPITKSSTGTIANLPCPTN